MLIKSIKNMSLETLARQILEEQVSNDWLGLGKEVKQICVEINIPNILKESVSKCEIKDAILLHHSEEMRDEMLGLKKMKNIRNEEFKNDYMNMKSIHDSRMMFRIRTDMLDFKTSMKGKYKGDTTCRGCKDTDNKEDQGHIAWCKGYATLRYGLDLTKDEDLITYYRRVMIERENNN